MYRIGLCWVSLFRNRIACFCPQNVGITECSPSSSEVHTLSYNQAPAILCLKNLKPLCWLNNSLPMDLYQSIQPLSCCDWLISLSRVFGLFLLYRIKMLCFGCSQCMPASCFFIHWHLGCLDLWLMFLWTQATKKSQEIQLSVPADVYTEVELLAHRANLKFPIFLSGASTHRLSLPLTNPEL